MGMTQVAQSLKIAYVMTAMAAALTLHSCAGNVAFAAEQDRVSDSSLQHSIDQLDDRLNELSDKVSTIQGIGTGALGALGALQVLGLIASVKTKKDP
jgi:TolA-binding protein